MSGISFLAHPLIILDKEIKSVKLLLGGPLIRIINHLVFNIFMLDNVVLLLSCSNTTLAIMVEKKTLFFFHVSLIKSKASWGDWVYYIHHARGPSIDALLGASCPCARLTCPLVLSRLLWRINHFIELQSTGQWSFRPDARLFNLFVDFNLLVSAASVDCCSLQDNDRDRVFDLNFRVGGLCFKAMLMLRSILGTGSCGWFSAEKGA